MMTDDSSRLGTRWAVLSLLVAVMMPTGAAIADEASASHTPPSEALVDGRYTIQLLALPDKEALETFVLETGVSGLMAKRIERDGENHYVLFTGSFEDRDAAITAADNLPGALATLTPWIRPLDPLLN